MKKLITVTIATVVAALMLFTVVMAAVDNGDFEEGTFNHWTITTFINNGYSSAQGSGGVDLSQIVGGPSVAPFSISDAHTNNVIKYPYSGHYSARVNSDQSYSLAGNGSGPNAKNGNTITQDISATLSSDGLAHISFVYAAVLVNPTSAPTLHDQETKPYFRVQVINLDNGNDVLYDFQSYAGEQGVDWQNGDVFNTYQGIDNYWNYLDWTVVDLSSLGHTVVEGDNIRVIVTVAGCEPGGHPGYVYVDNIINDIPAPISTVTSTATTTSTKTATVTETTTSTRTATAAVTPTATETATSTRTATAAATATSTQTATVAVTATRTVTPTRTATATPITIVLTSIAVDDGWVLESTETSSVGGTAVDDLATIIGDDAARRQYRGVLSFDTSVISDTASIIAVSLTFKQQHNFADPYATFQGVMFDVKNGFFGTSRGLELVDFQSPATAIYGPSLIPPNLVNDVYSFNLINSAPNINKSATNNGLTQIRIRFKLDDNGDAVANYLNLFSGNAVAPANRPMLTITYWP